MYRITTLILLVCALYFNSIQNEFTNWDDGLCTANKAEFKNALKLQWTATYQPVRNLSYVIDYYFWGENPVGYHIQTIGWYILCCFMVYLFTDKLFFLYFRSPHSNLAFLITIIFLIHPVHVEAVTWLASRKFILLGFFFFGSLYFYLSSRLILSFIFYILAVFSQPLAVVLPVFLPILDLILKQNKFTKISYWKKLFPFFVPNLFIVYYYLFVAGTTYYSYPYGGPYLTFLAMICFLVEYLKMLILPVKLCCRYAWAIPTTFFYLPIISSTIILSILSYVCYRLSKKNRLFFFGVLFFIITLIPVSNIIPISTRMADRYIFLPSYGFILCIFVLLRNIKITKNKIVSFLLLIALYSTLTINRNTVWKNSKTIWEDALRKYPSSVAYLNLGAYIYLEEKDLDKAIPYFKRAQRVDPKNTATYVNLALSYKKRGEFGKAIDQLKGCLIVNPQKIECYGELGVIYSYLNDYANAEKCFKILLENNPTDMHSLNFLGTVYKKQEKYKEAVKVLKKAQRIDNKNIEILTNLGSVYYHLNKKEKAVRYYKLASVLQPSFTAYNNLAVIYYQLGNKKESEKYYNQCVKINPSHPQLKLVQKFLIY